MEDTMSLVENEKIPEKIEKILRQTDYTDNVAREKLKEFNYDEIAVIRSYLGIKEKPKQQIKSVNQEIYKQLRTRLDTNMRDYKDRVERGEAKQI
jgi:hypothetical protein